VLRCLSKNPEERPTPAEIIEAARTHPEVGGQLRFTDDWLPAPVSGEIARRSDLSAALTGVGPADPAHPDGTLLLRPGGRRAPAPAEPPTTQHQQRSRRGSWKGMAAVAALTALGGVATGVLLTGGQHQDGGSADRASSSRAADTASVAPSGGATASPSGPAGPSGRPSPSGAPSPTARAVTYTAGYKDRTLAIAPDADQQFDLKNGKVEPGGALDWHLATYGPEFLPSDGTDAYIAKDGSALTAEQCAAGLDREPAGALKFEDLPPGRSFCLRSRAAGALVVLKVVRLTRDNGAATCTLTYYRADG
jgi:hypothetical protein